MKRWDYRTTKDYLTVIPKRFSNIHGHTQHSLSDAIGTPAQHIDAAMELGSDSICLTEHGNQNSLAAGLIHTKEIRSKNPNFKFVPGIELYITPSLSQWKEEYEKDKEEKKNKKRKERQELDIDSDEGTNENEEESKTIKSKSILYRRNHLVVLPKSRKGLENLYQLVSKSFKRENFFRFPRVDYKMLKEHSEDLVASTACIGGILAYEVLSELITDAPTWDLYKEKESIIQQNLENTTDILVDIFGTENLFLEIQFNSLQKQHFVNKALIDLSKKTGLKLVATCDAHYHKTEFFKDRELYRKLCRLKYDKFNPDELPKSIDETKADLSLKNSEQMWGAYKKYCSEYDFYNDQEVSDAIEISHDIVHQLIANPDPDTSIKLPSFVIPEGKTPFKILVDLCKQGMLDRGLATNREYMERLKYELEVIKEKKFANYFLTMLRIVEIAKKHMLVSHGRGSSAGSLICYCLGITNIDPIKYGLLFERFYGRSRNTPPDIDFDCADREQLIDLLKLEFGEDSIICITNFNTFRLKSLIKDLSKFHSIPFEEVNTVLKTTERETRSAVQKKGDDSSGWQLTFDSAMEHSPTFGAFIEKYPQLAINLDVLLKQNRNLGKHAGGIIIGENLEKQMPIITVKGIAQTPWAEGQALQHLEPLGFVKYDILSISTLKIVERTIELILEKQGVVNPTFDQIKEWYDNNLDPHKIDLNDQAVYEGVYHSLTAKPGIFQLSNPACIKFFQRAKPTSILNIADLTSIFRPGPLGANIDVLYIKLKNGIEEVKYEHPLVEKVLSETYGCVVYQEQVMQLAIDVGGLTSADSDKLRKIMGKKIKDSPEMKKYEEQFSNGAVARGLEKRDAESIFARMKEFAKYGFNKSHSASYGVLSYQTAFLLHYHPAEWICAYIENSISKPEERTRALSEAKSFGYSILPVDINTSDRKWKIYPGKKFAPSFLTVKGIGASAIEEIQSHRPYKDIYNFLYNEDGSWKHSKVSKKVLEALIKTEALGSLDCVGKGKLFSSYRHLHHVVIENDKDIKKSLKRDPFIGRKKLDELALATANIPDWTTSEKIQFRKDLLGYFDTDLVVNETLQAKMSKLDIESIDSFSEDDIRRIVWFVVDSSENKISKRGKPYILMNVLGASGNLSKMFCWGTKEDTVVENYSVIVADVDKSDFGYATSLFKMRIL